MKKKNNIHAKIDGRRTEIDESVKKSAANTNSKSWLSECVWIYYKYVNK